jgi:hypothetical protein
VAKASTGLVDLLWYQLLTRAIPPVSLQVYTYLIIQAKKSAFGLNMTTTKQAGTKSFKEIQF